MSDRKIARQRHRMQRRGFMVVHSRWLLTEARATNETPWPWLNWHYRRPA